MVIEMHWWRVGAAKLSGEPHALAARRPPPPAARRPSSFPTLPLPLLLQCGR